MWPPHIRIDASATLTDSLIDVSKFQGTSRSAGNLKITVHIGLGVEPTEKLEKVQKKSG